MTEPSPLLPVESRLKKVAKLSIKVIEDQAKHANILYSKKFGGH